MVEANKEEGRERQEGVGEEKEGGKKEREGREQAWEDKVRKAGILTGTACVLGQLGGPPLPVLSVDFTLACVRAQIKYSVCHQLKEDAAHSTLVPSPLGNPPRVQSLLLQKLIIHSVNPRTCLFHQSELWLNSGRRRLYHSMLKNSY